MDEAAAQSVERPAEPARRPCVLHLAVDYPSPNKPDNTVAVRNFVRANRAVDHVVVALTRTPDPRKVNLLRLQEPAGERLFAMRYWGLPLGLLHAPSLAIAARCVLALLRREGIRVDLVHAHKLLFEGIAGYFVARALGVRLVCSARGEAETKALRFLPHYAPLFRRMIGYCTRLYYVSAWLRPELERRYPSAAGKGELLPNICPGEWKAAPQAPAAGRFVSILHLDIWRKKGLGVLLPAFAEHLRSFPDATLDIVGRGRPAVFERIGAMIEALGLRGRVSLLGALEHEALAAALPGYGVMCLPSRNETFGMVYVEALLSGVPAVYSRGTGIDGFLDGIEGAIGVDPRSVRSVADGLARAQSEQSRLRAWLVAHRALVQARFDAARMVAGYNRTLGLVP